MGEQEQALIVREMCDWSDISRLCSKLSALLDRFDRDWFAYMLRYGQTEAPPDQASIVGSA